MIDSNAFMETVRLVAEVAQASDKVLSKDEIADYFKEMNLCEEQLEAILRYLRQLPEDGQPGRDRSESAADTGKHPVRDESGSEFFKMYQNDMDKIRPCTRLEEETMYQKLSQGDQTVLHQLSEQWLLRVFRLAETYDVPAGEMQDVIQEGNMGIYLALEKLSGCDEKKDFKKILTRAAKTAMEEYLRQTDTEKDVAQSVMVKASLVHEAGKFLTEEFQRTPTIEELSQYTKLAVEELENILTILKEKK